MLYQGTPMLVRRPPKTCIIGSNVEATALHKVPMLQMNLGYQANISNCGMIVSQG